MSCHRINIGGHPGIVTIADGYKFGGFYFEWHFFCGPTKLRKNGEFAKKQGRKFYKAIGEWQKLSKKQREKYRIYG